MMNEFDFDDEVIKLTSEEDKNDNVNNMENVIDGYEKRVYLDNQDEQSVEEEREEKEEPITEKREEKYHKKTLKEKWQDLDKKKKVLIILGLVILLLVIIGVVVYFLVFRKPEEPKPNPNENDTVVIEKDNYKYSDGNLIFLDKDDNEIGTYECTNKDDKKCLIKKVDNADDKFDRVRDIDTAGNEIAKNTPIYYNKYVFIEDGEDKFLYNIESKEKELQIKSVKVYGDNNEYIVTEDTSNHFGLLEISSDKYEYKIKATYDYLGVINPATKCILAKDKTNTYIIDFNGKKITSNINADIKSVNSEFVVGKVGNSYNLYDYQFNELVSEYDFIGLNDNVISLVKGNRLYLLDNNLNKLNEDGIRLESIDNLVPVNVFENNKLKEKLSAYSIEVKNNKAYVTSKNDIKEINMLEGIVSSNYELISYFDGRIYFYSDNTKTNVIGSYTCTNKNVLKNASDTLTDCYVYAKDNKYSSIYNNEYVFIYDNLSNSNNNIYLYDLKTNRVRSTYSDITILNENEMNDDIKAIYTSSSYIIAKSATGNNAGNYGVLLIDSDGVQGKIDFKYKDIKKANKYYVLVSSTNEYSIYNKDFEKVSEDFAYIEAYDEYYAAVESGKLNIYRYNSALSILEEAIDVSNNEFKIDFTDGFKITVGENEYKFDKNGKKITEPETSEPSKEENDSEGEDNNGE